MNRIEIWGLNKVCELEAFALVPIENYFDFVELNPLLDNVLMVNQVDLRVFQYE